MKDSRLNSLACGGRCPDATISFCGNFERRAGTHGRQETPAAPRAHTDILLVSVVLISTMLLLFLLRITARSLIPFLHYFTFLSDKDMNTRRCRAVWLYSWHILYLRSLPVGGSGRIMSSDCLSVRPCVRLSVMVFLRHPLTCVCGLSQNYFN